jgi:glucokinase
MQRGTSMKATHIIGLDIGGTSAKIGLVERQTGKIVEKAQIKTLQAATWQQIFDEYLVPIHKWITRYKSIGGIGIGIPGLYNTSLNLLNNCENIPALSRAPFVEYVKEQCGVPVFADNDATCATIGEHLFGAGTGFSDFMMLTIGTGIGGGLILNNEVYRGKNGYAGEIGHIIVVPEGRVCNCGNRGCIESYSSATAMINRIKYGIKKGYITEGFDNPETITAKDIFDQALKGEPYSLDIVNEAARYLGRILGGIVNLLNLEAIIIGGGVASAGDFFLNKIEFYCDQIAWYLLSQELQFVQAKLKNNAGIIGSASLAIAELERDEKDCK